MVGQSGGGWRYESRAARLESIPQRRRRGAQSDGRESVGESDRRASANASELTGSSGRSCKEVTGRVDSYQPLGPQLNNETFIRCELETGPRRPANSITVPGERNRTWRRTPPRHVVEARPVALGELLPAPERRTQHPTSKDLVSFIQILLRARQLP